MDNNLKFTPMHKEERKIYEREGIKIDDHTPEIVSGGRTGNKSVVKDNQKLIMAFVFLAILALMGILQAHYGAILAVTAVEAILIYLVHKEGYDNIQK